MAKQVTRRRWLVWGGVALVVAVLLALAMRPAAVEVDIEPVTRGRLAVTLDEEGETRVRDRYVVSAPVAGRVQRIELEPGDRVAAGETVVATFLASDPALLDVRARGEVAAQAGAARANAERTRAERDARQAQLEFARVEHERYRRLAAEGVVSRERRDQARRDLDTARENLAAGEQAVRGAVQEQRAAEARAMAVQAPAQRGDAMVLRSPIDGVVLQRSHESAAVVPAGAPLLEIADLDELEIVADFLSADAVAMRPGMEVEIGRWGGPAQLTGRVRRVEPAGFLKVSALGVEEQRVNVIIDLADPRQAWSALGDGYRVEVRVVVWEAADVVKAPASGLFRHGDGWAAFVVRGERAELTPVKVGHRNDREVEVVSGLAPGDRLVAYPPEDLEDGAKLEVRESSVPAG